MSRLVRECLRREWLPSSGDSQEVKGRRGAERGRLGTAIPAGVEGAEDSLECVRVVGCGHSSPISVESCEQLLHPPTPLTSEPFGTEQSFAKSGQTHLQCL